MKVNKHRMKSRNWKSIEEFGLLFYKIKNYILSKRLNYEDIDSIFIDFRNNYLKERGSITYNHMTEIIETGLDEMIGLENKGIQRFRFLLSEILHK